jgi:hypothetical protein
MTDPRSLSPDQRELIDACEKVALLPVPLVEDDFQEASEVVCDLLEARGQALRGEARLTPEALLKYELGMRRDGHEVAADGLRRMIAAYNDGVAWRAALS